jgi:hypothetical protein
LAIGVILLFAVFLTAGPFTCKLFKYNCNEFYTVLHYKQKAEKAYNQGDVEKSKKYCKKAKNVIDLYGVDPWLTNDTTNFCNKIN